MGWANTARLIGSLSGTALADVEPTPRADPTDRLAQLVASEKLERITKSFAMQIPSVRMAHALVTKRTATFGLRVYEGAYPVPDPPTWVDTPSRTVSRFTLVAQTLDDAIWHDRAYWHADRWAYDSTEGLKLAPETRFTRVDPSRCLDLHNPDGSVTVMVDGTPARDIIRFGWEGLGGLGGAGDLVMNLAVKLLEAANRFADSPVPSVVLKNAGVELDAEEIEALLSQWDTARATRATAFLNRMVELEKVGWNATDLQLLESAQHMALEVARAFALPATAVEATGGDGLTYANITDRRRELSESLRIWRAPIEAELTRRLPNRNRVVRFDDHAYVRDDPKTRMDIWASGVASGVLTVSEARDQEPLAIREATP